MTGLLLYKQYLNNVCNSLINYDFPKIDSKDIGGVLEASKDIEDLSYLDKILSYSGSDGLFDKNKDFLRKLVRLESKLKDFMNVESLENIISLDSLYDVEDNIIEFCGDLSNLDNGVNYKNFSVDDLSLGDNIEDLGVNKLITYQKEIENVFGFMEDVKVEVGKKFESVKEDEEPKDTSNNFKTVPIIEENEQIEGLDEEEIDDIDAWVEQNDMELIKKYRDRDIKEEYFENEETDLFIENIKKIEEVDFIDKSIEPLLNNELDETKNILDLKELKNTEISGSFFKKEEKVYKKKEKLVEHKAVTDIDDTLAKMFLALDDKLNIIPKSAGDIVKKVKGSSKNIYTHMVVDDDEED